MTGLGPSAPTFIPPRASTLRASARRHASCPLVAAVVLGVARRRVERVAERPARVAGALARLLPLFFGAEPLALALAQPLRVGPRHVHRRRDTALVGELVQIDADRRHVDRRE